MGLIEAQAELERYLADGGRKGSGCAKCYPTGSGVTIHGVVNLYQDRVKMERGFLVPKMIRGEYVWHERDKIVPGRYVYGQWVDPGKVPTREVNFPCRRCSQWPWIYLGPDESVYCFGSEEEAADIAATLKVRLVSMFTPKEVAP
jgi:hypothetical protein